MFRESLTRIVEGTGGAVGALLMGYDGIAIETFSDPESSVDLNLIGIEYSNIVKEIRQTAEVLQSGELEEVAIKTESYYIVLRHLTEEYFVALILVSSGNFGQGRYHLLRESFWLREELS
jgi:predicted regulator of Ras-like GTPase activity (Roadblock/LC7/MglB family)